VTYRLVVGVDGSSHGDAALRWAIAEARVHKGEIVAVFAWQMPFIGVPAAFDRDEMERLSLAFVDEAVAAVVDDDSVPVTKLVAQGDVSGSLIAACRELEADILVLGSRGRGGFAGLKLGSVSQECVQHAACPVVIIKQPGDG
jgi:nucleotide-binding universal stress UspA family protein